MLRRYKYWNFISQVCSGVNFSLSTNSILISMDITNPITSGTAAFIYKDIIGQTSTLLYSHLPITKYIDKKPKKYSIYTCSLVQISCLCENLIVFYPNLFLPLSISGSILKNCGFTGLSGINIKCIYRLTNNNEGEFYAKLNASNSVASSIGMGLGIMINQFYPTYTMIFFPIFSLIHVYSFNRCVKICLT